MSDKETKPKKPAKSRGDQPSVLASLPSTRPERIGRRASADAPKPSAKKPEATRSTAASRAARTERAAAAKRRAERPKPAPEPAPRSAPPKGPELVTTAIQAVGEVAQIGLTVGGQVLKRAAKRLPRP